MEHLVSKLLNKIENVRYKSNIAMMNSSFNRDSSKRCFYCKKVGHVQRNCDTKPALVCNYCNKQNHSMLVCKKYHHDMACQNNLRKETFKQKNKQKEFYPKMSSESEHTITGSTTSSMKLTVNVNSEELSALTDTGAFINAIDLATVKRLKLFYRKSTRKSVSCADGRDTKVFGILTIHLMINSESFPATFHVMNISGTDLILGRPFLDAYQANIDFSSNTLQLTSVNNSTLTVILEGKLAKTKNELKETEEDSQSDGKLLDNLNEFVSEESNVLASLDFKQVSGSVTKVPEIKNEGKSEPPKGSDLPTPTSTIGGDFPRLEKIDKGQEEVRRIFDISRNDFRENKGNVNFYYFCILIRIFLVSICFLQYSCRQYPCGENCQQLSTSQTDLKVIRHSKQLYATEVVDEHSVWSHCIFADMEWHAERFKLGHKYA